MHVTMTLGVTNMLSYLSYFGTGIFLLLAAGFIYVKFTPLDEMSMIRNGNGAAATMLAGAAIGFSLVLYSSMTHGQSLADFAIWSVIALISQIIAFEILRFILYLCHDNWMEKINAGEMAHGIFFGAFSLSIGILNAASVT
jgi:putative membrane protein